MQTQGARTIGGSGNLNQHGVENFKIPTIYLTTEYECISFFCKNMIYYKSFELYLEHVSATCFALFLHFLIISYIVTDNICLANSIYATSHFKFKDYCTQVPAT